jgi:hypothetical protein
VAIAQPGADVRQLGGEVGERTVQRRRDGAIGRSRGALPQRVDDEP